MKVICIADIGDKCRNTGRIVSVPNVGDIDIVIGMEIYWGEKLYLLERFGKKLGFSMHQFIPLSDIDETLMKREYSVIKTST